MYLAITKQALFILLLVHFEMTCHNTENILALVIKCQKSHDRDLLVTLLTAEHGKIITVAKGVCRLNSHKKPYLQSGNLIHVHLVQTKNWPLLTQATLVNEVATIRQDLNQLRRFLLFLEILDQIMVDEELDPTLFQKILYLRELLLQQVSNRLVQNQFQKILVDLGFTDNKKPLTSVSGLVSNLTNRQLHSYDYLRL